MKHVNYQIEATYADGTVRQIGALMTLKEAARKKAGLEASSKKAGLLQDGRIKTLVGGGCRLRVVPASFT